MVLIAQRVASSDILDTNDGGNIAGVTRLDVFAFVCLDLNQPRNALALVRARIVNRVALAQRAAINTEENQLPTNGSLQSLKASEQKLPLSSVGASIGSPVSGS